jgi:hypothetical protein
VCLSFWEDFRDGTFPAFYEIQPHPIIRHPTDFQNFAVRTGQNFVFQSFAHLTDVEPATASGQAEQHNIGAEKIETIRAIKIASVC